MRLQRSFDFAQQMALAYMRRGLTLVLIGTAAAAFMMLLIGVLFMSVLMEYGVNILEMLQMVIQSASAIAFGLSILLVITLVWNIVGAGIATILDDDDLSRQKLQQAIPSRLLAFNAIGLPLLLISMIILGGFNLFGVMCMGSLTLILGVIAGDMARTSWQDVVDRYQLREQRLQHAAKVRDYLQKKHAKQKADSEEERDLSRLIEEMKHNDNPNWDDEAGYQQSEA